MKKLLLLLLFIPAIALAEAPYEGVMDELEGYCPTWVNSCSSCHTGSPSSGVINDAGKLWKKNKWNAAFGCERITDQVMFKAINKYEKSADDARNKGVKKVWEISQKEVKDGG